MLVVSICEARVLVSILFQTSKGVNGLPQSDGSMMCADLITIFAPMGNGTPLDRTPLDSIPLPRGYGASRENVDVHGLRGRIMRNSLVC